MSELFPLTMESKEVPSDVSSWKSFKNRIDVKSTKGAFDEKGYLNLVDFLSLDEINCIDKHLLRYRESVLPQLPSNFVFYENKSDANTIIRLERMLWHDEFFKALACAPAFNGLADLLLEESCKPDNVQWFSKPPGAKPTPPHQDGKYFMHGRGITFWLAMDDADESNGAMFYCPGTQKLGLLDHSRSDQIGFSQQLTEFPVEMKETELLMAATKGTLLGHHPWTVHRAAGNTTKARWRPALGLTYWAQSCYQDADLMQKHDNYQKQLLHTMAGNDKI